MLYYIILVTIAKVVFYFIILGAAISAAFLSCVNPQAFYEYTEWWTKLAPIEKATTELEKIEGEE
jgi:hypothetical protein